MDPGNWRSSPLPLECTSAVGVIFEDAALRVGGVKTIWTGCNCVCRILMGSAEVNSSCSGPRSALIHFLQHYIIYIQCFGWGFPGSAGVKNPPVKAGDEGMIPGLERSPGGRNGIPLQYSCLENSMNREALGAIVHWVAKVGHN